MNISLEGGREAIKTGGREYILWNWRGYNNLLLATLPLISKSFKQVSMCPQKCCFLAYALDIYYFSGQYPQSDRKQIIKPHSIDIKSFSRSASDYLFSPSPTTSPRSLWLFHIEVETTYMHHVLMTPSMLFLLSGCQVPLYIAYFKAFFFFLIPASKPRRSTFGRSLILNTLSYYIICVFLHDYFHLQ